MASRIEIFTDDQGAVRFRMTATNGSNIVTSEAYTRAQLAWNDIESLKALAAVDSHYERNAPTPARFFFVLKTIAGETICTSGIYYSAAARDKDIGTVKREAPGARIDDLTD